ncbi:MAG TPA: hypothetical protein VMD99_00955 [Terriglobales bacterium]|nr:hypothetical protein [Terriglobales bacterium]
MAESSRRSSGADAARVSRVFPWVMPAAADLIFVGLLGGLVFTPLAVKLLGDAGIGWHIRTGQLILATHAVPRVDVFSATAHGKPWFAWEWGYDVVVGWLESVAGLNGVVWFTAVVIAAVFGWLFRLLVARGTNFFVAVGLTLLAMSASTIHFLARPHVVSWLFTLAWFWMLDSAERGCGLRRLWILPAMMLVWVNVHGGFLVGFVLLGIFWIGAAWEWWTARAGRIEEVLDQIAAGRRVRALSLVGVVSVAASLVNPYGWKLYGHIYWYLTNRFLMDHIEEFQSPNFHGVAQKCFLGMVVILVAVLAAGEIPTSRAEGAREMGHPLKIPTSRAEGAREMGHPLKIPTSRAKGAREMGHPVRGLRLSAGLTVLFAVYAGLYAARNIPVAAVLLAMVVGPMLPGFAPGFSERMGAIESGLRGHTWAMAAVALTFLIAWNGGRVGAKQVMAAHFDPARMPVGAVNFLERRGTDGPIFSPDYWGGYLIYRLNRTPGMPARVVVDDRHDLYGEQFLKQYLKIWHVEEQWRYGWMAGRQLGFLVLPRNAALTNALCGDPVWKEIYRDDTAVVFENGSVSNQ